MKNIGREYYLTDNTGVIYDISNLPAYQKTDQEGIHRLARIDKFVANFECENDLKLFLTRQNISVSDGPVCIAERNPQNQLLRVSKGIYQNDHKILNITSLKKVITYLLRTEPVFARIWLNYLENHCPYEEKITFTNRLLPLKAFVNYAENKNNYQVRAKDYDRKRNDAIRVSKVLVEMKTTSKKGGKLVIDYRFIHDLAVFTLNSIYKLEYLRYVAEIYIEKNHSQKYALNGFKKTQCYGSKMTFEQFLALKHKDRLEQLDIPKDEDKFYGKYINLNDILSSKIKLESVQEELESLKEFTRSYNRKYDTFFTGKELLESYNDYYGVEQIIEEDIESLKEFTKKYNREYDTFFTDNELLETYNECYGLKEEDEEEPEPIDEGKKLKRL